MILTLLINLMIIMSNSPIIMIMMIMSLTIINAILLMTKLKFSWFSLMLILMMLGGMIILFIYIASLSPNNMNINVYYSPIMLIIMTLSYFKINNNMLISSKNYIFQLMTSFSFLSSILIMLYLLMSLFLILKLMMNINNPLVLN
uniref:NADH dehydrogenase subunit 6 n=1 Tax=Uroobovella oviformis TaxID=3106009 RepID=UPI002E7A1462|nr:NADH dehydrogenase subunit 6 [Uroobovella oviformis]WPV72076.1 NADH dehydrogenase subunit 6 [Uroobovella oviformis]